MQEFLEIGQIVNTFGIKGMVKVKPFTDDVIARYDNLKKVYIEIHKSKKQYEIEEVKYHKDMVLIKFKGIDKIEEAELLRNAYLKVDRKDELGKQLLLPAISDVIKEINLEEGKIVVHILKGLI